MPVADPFEGGQEHAESEKKALLDAIAQAGAAGKAAYETAKAETGKMQQSALERAKQRARLTGQELGGADVAPVAETADRFGTYFTGQQAAGQNLLGQIGASGESFLSKIGAITPFMRQKAATEAAEREKTLQLAVQQNQARIDAEKAAAAEAHKRDIELLKLRASLDETSAEKAATRAAIQKAQEAKPPSIDAVLGAAANYAKAPAAPLPKGGTQAERDAIAAAEIKRQLAGSSQKGLLDFAVGTGRELGVPNIEELYLREKGITAPAATPPPAPLDKNWLTSAFRYEGKPISAKRADEVLRAPEVQITKDLVTQLSGIKRDPVSGMLDEDVYFRGQKFPTRGMTPRQVLDAALELMPGIKTMKTALRDYYGGYLDQLGRP